jgi:hypothetical protein
VFTVKLLRCFYIRGSRKLDRDLRQLFTELGDILYRSVELYHIFFVSVDYFPVHSCDEHLHVYVVAFFRHVEHLRVLSIVFHPRPVSCSILIWIFLREWVASEPRTPL